MATYIDSGNAIVRSQLSCKAVYVPTLAEWDYLIVRNPFALAVADAPSTVHTGMLASAAAA